MFTKVLVANRGEIAGRILRTLHRLHIASVIVHSEADAATLPVRTADEAVCIGPAAPASSYLDIAAVVDAARQTGAQAVHPGYGFLAERAEFAEAVEAAGLTFIGPTPDQLRAFGAKHRARQLAVDARVPLAPASSLLSTVDEAVQAAATVGFPLLLKATAGGGGIGMRVCADAEALEREFDGVQRQALAAFGDGGIYIERYLRGARHVEVQIAGDGQGRVVVVGDRDCSMQRRNQKVVEESPAPRLPAALRTELHEAARRLAAAVSYRSVGTVEFLVDPDRELIAFLEVNARLQVEHTVTEAVHGVDLVEWMLRIAAGDGAVLDEMSAPRGHAIEVRVCAENPWQQHQPSAGTVTAVNFPDDVRVDTWIEPGTDVTPFYDSLLAKVVVHARTRDEAADQLGRALGASRVEGITTNLDLLRAIVADSTFRDAKHHTGALDAVALVAPVIEVLTGGTQTTVQDMPGRIGFWAVGVPPSGPMDARSFGIGNTIVGNPEGAPGLEMTMTGPRLLFHADAVVCLAGAPTVADIDGQPFGEWTAVPVAAGAVLTIGAIGPPGIRAYLLVRGAIDVPPVLGSASTFTLGGFGGHGGRALRPGDILRLATTPTPPSAGPPVAGGSSPPAFTDAWEIGVDEGPHADEEFLTRADIDALFDADWRVHHNSARTGVRLVGPTPTWSRPDGGEAGLHPSNIHDTPYAVGAVDFTGDMPILLGPDGPSLGGFVCPAVVMPDERWKLGQLRPDDTVRFVRARAGSDADAGILDRWEADGDRPSVAWRRSGSDYLLVEYGPMVLDLALRFRIHALQRWVEDQAVAGVIDVTPGIRSLQIHFDPAVVTEEAILTLLRGAEAELPAADDTVVESRVVHLPLSWDDPATREAIDRYMSTVRADAPWCPWNIEFIRRINGLADVSDVHRVVFDASYLVLGLGDVYLGAPVATPLDPRHRLVTTKYNPARTWTPENAVGIGGAYLCIYGMEGPGGYQFVGRTVPVWNRFRRTADFTEPWLLRFFDQIRFFEVDAADLLVWRRDLLTGKASLAVDASSLRLAEQVTFLNENAEAIAEFRQRQQNAFNEERARWGNMTSAPTPSDARVEPVPTGAVIVESALRASVWKVLVSPGEQIAEGDVVAVLEAMKMETSVLSPYGGRVAQVLVRPGQEVSPGQPLVAVFPS